MGRFRALVMVRGATMAAVAALAAGKMAQPPTTAECEADFGIACYQPFQL